MVLSYEPVRISTMVRFNHQEGIKEDSRFPSRQFPPIGLIRKSHITWLYCPLDRGSSYGYLSLKQKFESCGNRRLLSALKGLVVSGCCESAALAEEEKARKQTN
jgi:hypothetical protein